MNDMEVKYCVVLVDAPVEKMQCCTVVSFLITTEIFYFNLLFCFVFYVPSSTLF